MCHYAQKRHFLEYGACTGKCGCHFCDHLPLLMNPVLFLHRIKADSLGQDHFPSTLKLVQHRGAPYVRHPHLIPMRLWLKEDAQTRCKTHDRHFCTFSYQYNSAICLNQIIINLFGLGNIGHRHKTLSATKHIKNQQSNYFSFLGWISTFPYSY